MEESVMQKGTPKVWG